jgi:membrane-bound lytic murein transglycosylase D
VPLRILFAAFFLFLSGCATTTSTPPAPEPEAPVVAAEPENVPSSTATIDEHLFIPEHAAEVVHDNVWDRMLHNFALPDCTVQEEALTWAQWYADHPAYMERIFKRAQPWIHYIVDELERREMPGEIALLPIVESAYDPFAYSSGQALGTWQFIASTGKHYGLDQNWWYDGRRDVWASTAAALDYLEYMHGMFEGDWLLALAGYNSGENRVYRQAQKNIKAGKPADFWHLRLPRETRGYVPKLMGLGCLFQNPAEYDFAFPDTPNNPVVAAVDIGQQADLVLVSQMAEVPIDVLFTLNPGYSRWATAPEGPYRVVLPLENAAELEKQLQRIDASSLMRWDQVVVQNGDTLSHISARQGVPVSVLRTANDLDGDFLRAGQKLRLPRDDQQMQADPLYTQAAMELQQLQSGLISTRRVTHKVRSGESLSVIARRYRVSVRDLQRWNNISDPRTLRAGKTITVYHSSATPGSATSGSTKYVVRRGDSLWSIARKHNVRVNDLKSWNGLGNDTLQPGQSLRIQR